MNRANVLIQIFAQITVWVVGVFIGLLHGILELEAAVVRRSRSRVVHAGKLVAVEREGQVVHQAVGRSRRLPVALQAQDVAVLVVTGHFFCEAVRVRADGRAFAVGGRCQAVQPVVGELVATGSCLVARLPRQAAEVAIVLLRAVACGVIQVLGELASADARQPTAQVVGIRLLVAGVAVQVFRLQPAQVIVGIACQRRLRAAQAVRRLRQAVCLVVGVAVGLGAGCLPVGRVRVRHGRGFVRQGVRRGRHVRAAQQVGTHLLRHAPFQVVVIGFVEGGTAFQRRQDAARLQAFGVDRPRGEGSAVREA